MSDEDYEFLREFVEVIGPIAHGITLLEGDKHYFGMYLPTLFGIKNRLMEMESRQNFMHCKPLLDAVIDGFDNRFKAMMDPTDSRSIPLYIAMVTDPKYKLNYIPPFIWNSSTLQRIKNMLLTAAEKILRIPGNQDILDVGVIQEVAPDGAEADERNGKFNIRLKYRN